MSFSSKVKQEIGEHLGNGRHCRIAELSSFVNICGHIGLCRDYFCLKIQTENYLVAKKCFTLLKNAFNINSEIFIKSGGKKRRSKVYVLFIKDSDQVERLLRATGILLTKEGLPVIRNKLNPTVVSSICCRRAYIRGAFISVGSVNNPEKNYHLEFVLSSWELATQLRDLVNTFDLDSKVVERKDHFVVYLKEGEQIVDLLNIMGAHIALMDLENVRIVKEMRNDINRKVNCETANLNKVVLAAVKQLEDITYIQQTIGLDKLPMQLQEVARLRLDYPDTSLKELGTYLAEPVGKSGVNHRLRKISNLAETLREGKGEEK
ncbi:sporulation transcription regulator WhiA [Anaerotignum neopropionicum]|uniref:Probable cell division protein WhiA n=1 Tax=Anaerotignum neopropionicum TaxID=36847 RepID=A0A136WFG1_9FIRM|nr:DNA-binding protein WhiA [Anaerotignum neopropionicum]KXL53296.1 sporulation transcription regulator WhiA [Anaerotignum neopropionicum]